MYLYSDPTDDIQHAKNEAGAYEWWYFDALDPISGYGIVVIFYDGLLFSPDYHTSVKMGVNDTAIHHPGFSLSIYNADKTIFYSLASYSQNKSKFGGSTEPVQIGKNRVEVVMNSNQLVFNVHIDEILPSGLRANGLLRFESLPSSSRSVSGSTNSPHKWNLIQPGALAKGEVIISHKERKIDTCLFDTKGYHDHNIGLRPLEYDFDEWYWGRVHIGDDTLVWYNMCSSGIAQSTAWLFKNGEVDFARQVRITPTSDVATSVFGLNRTRSWIVDLDDKQVRIIDNQVWDNGPFYQRYRVKLVDMKGRIVDDSIPGIAEYILPGRITANWVKPMIQIRYRKEDSMGNWIQRSSMLSRFTW